MVKFLVEEVLDRLDKFVNIAENAVDSENLGEAERIGMEFKRETADIVELLENTDDKLTELVIKFASLARVPITINSSSV
jgi:hypothetical protein